MRDNGRYNKRNGVSETNESQMVSVHYLFGLITMAMVTMVLSSSLYSCCLTEVPFIVDINCNCSVLVPHPSIQMLQVPRMALALVVVTAVVTHSYVSTKKIDINTCVHIYNKQIIPKYTKYIYRSQNSVEVSQILL